MRLYVCAAAGLQHMALQLEEGLSLMQETLDTKDAGNRKQTGVFTGLVGAQHESFQARKAKYKEIRNKVDDAINKKFKEMLRTGRNWRGTVQVDHDARQVKLSVTPHKGAWTCPSTMQELLFRFCPHFPLHCSSLP